MRPSPRLLRAGWRRMWLLWSLLGLASACAQPVVLQLRNGDRITGMITSEDATRVVLSTSWAKEVIVPLAEILKREAAPVAAVPPADAVAPESTAPPPAPAPTPPPKHWVADLQMGVDLVFSERDRQLYSGRFKVTYAQNRFRNIVDYDFSYGRTDGTLSANRMDGFIKTDFDLGQRLYVYNLAGAGYDEIRKIDARYQFGPGVGYHLIQATNFVLNTEFGANYQVQQLADDTETDLFFYRFAEDFTWRLSQRLTLDEKFEFSPRVEDVEQYRFRFESNLRFWLVSNLSFIVTVIDQYDTLPARTVTRNDLQVRSSIGLKF